MKNSRNTQVLFSVELSSSLTDLIFYQSFTQKVTRSSRIKLVFVKTLVDEQILRDLYKDSTVSGLNFSSIGSTWLVVLVLHLRPTGLSVCLSIILEAAGEAMVLQEPLLELEHHFGESNEVSQIPLKKKQ